MPDTDKNYKCQLTPETLQKAKEELHEDPATRIMEVKVLRKRVEGVPGLTSRTDARFLLGFLRGQWFDQEKTFKLVKDFYQLKVDKKDIFQDLKPSRVRHVIESRAIEVLKQRDNQGRRVVVFRSHLWDPDRCSFIDTMRLWVIIAQRLMEEEETQVNGILSLYNMRGITTKHIGAVGPLKAKLLITICFYCFPIHIRQVDFFFENKLFDVFYAIFSPFLDSELTKKIRFNGKNTAVLGETMDPDHIPTDLGGNQDMHSNQGWLEELLEMDKWFEDANKFGFVSLKLQDEKKENNKEHAGMSGLGGSFKKLQV